MVNCRCERSRRAPWECSRPDRRGSSRLDARGLRVPRRADRRRRSRASRGRTRAPGSRRWARPDDARSRIARNRFRARGIRAAAPRVRYPARRLRRGSRGCRKESRRAVSERGFSQSADCTDGFRNRPAPRAPGARSTGCTGCQNRESGSRESDLGEIIAEARARAKPARAAAFHRYARQAARSQREFVREIGRLPPKPARLAVFLNSKRSGVPRSSRASRKRDSRKRT